MPDVRRLRSLLFVPGSRPDMVAKMPRFAPDAVVVDLEDAVAISAKDDARRQAVEAVNALAADEQRPALILIRINQPGTPWYDEDLAALWSSRADGVVLPKLERFGDRDALVSRMSRKAVVIGGIESAAGVAEVRGLLARGLTAAYFGAEDYIADLGGRRTPGNLEVLHARSQVALAGRLAGIPVLDQVVVDIGDADRFTADAQQGVDLGYSGKMCIHPSQVPLAHRVFTPDEDAVAHARAVLQASESGVAVIDGEMVDAVHVKLARAVLARADTG